MVNNKQYLKELCLIFSFIFIPFCSLYPMLGRKTQDWDQFSKDKQSKHEIMLQAPVIEARVDDQKVDQIALAIQRCGICIASDDRLAARLSNYDLDKSPFSQKKLLDDKDGTRDKMIKRGCISVDFRTSDNKKINALLRFHPKAVANVIVLVGWNPGRVEGASLLMDMLSREKYNILFVNVRYHGRSEPGSLWWHLTDLGVHEPKDVIAALNFLRYQTRHIMNGTTTIDTTQKPIFIYGICAGAFHALNAVKDLKKDEVDQLGLRGIIADGAWGRVSEVVKETGLAMGSKNKVAQKLLMIVKWLFFDRSFKRHESKTCLYGKIGDLQVPVYFFHAKDDERARLKHVKALLGDLHRTGKNPSVYLFDGNCHGALYLKWKYLFRNALVAFLASRIEAAS